MKIISDAEVEPEPLWEYPCRAEAEPKPIMTFDLTQDIEVQNSIAKFANLNLKKRGSGMVFWMQWFLTDEDIVNTGPVKDVTIGQHIGKILKTCNVRTRTCNPQIRSLMPPPLDHTTFPCLIIVYSARHLLLKARI